MLMCSEIDVPGRQYSGHMGAVFSVVSLPKLANSLDNLNTDLRRFPNNAIVIKLSIP